MKKTTKAMWEILVPTIRNNGKPFRLRYHKIWDSRVRAISGGLTIMPVAKGQWVFHEKLYEERVIPVRIIATKVQMENIVKMTMEYYDQEAVLAYMVGSEVILRHRNGEGDI